MKITQAQIRVIRNMLRTKAATACSIAATLAQQNHKANEAKTQAVANKIMKKYEKRLVKSFAPNVDNIKRGYYNACAVSFDEQAVEEFANEVRAALDALPTTGSDRTVKVAIASLNMLQEYGRRDENCMLEVPHNEAEKWQELAREIDSSFLSGDATKLAWLINNFS